MHPFWRKLEPLTMGRPQTVWCLIWVLEPRILAPNFRVPFTKLPETDFITMKAGLNEARRRAVL